ncbi:putative RNA-directed DNA polymerase from transposon BS-like protein [Cladobotryum mycophilum]|uniref:RNA-directed DNA polymerase from transposon BS-like protein n=1 Tax=Cladobotryum mycophilum TaxID=491253 RepID=A0ABR0SW84_9HYPO
MYAEEHKVLNAFSTAFDAIAKQFTTDHARKIATALTNAFKSACISALNPKEPPKGNTTTYASVLHNTQGPGPTAPQKPQAHTKHPPGTKETVHPDLRILVRLEKQSPAWQKEPAAIRDVISKALSMPISRIPKATQTATGWAIHTADQGVQREVLERKEEWIRLLGALHAETRQIWYNYIVEECPRTIPTWDGRPVDFNECFREEVITQTGTAPVSFRPTRKNEPHAPTQKMIVSFPTPITKRWRLFGSSRMARYLEKSKLPEQCVWCWDYHSWRHCSRKQRCNRCGKTDHDFETCQRPEQCPNCLEPAPPNHKDCSMKPYKARGAIQRPTQHQRKTARTTGAQRYRQRNPEHTTAPNEDRTQFTEARFSPHLANEKERPAGEERDNDPITIDAEPLSPQPPEGPEEEEPTNPITPPGPGSATSLSTEAPAASLVVSPGAFPETKKKVPPQLNHQSMTRPNSSNKDLARTKTLRIFQANVGKIGPAHDTALALADTEEFDIILMQEPWLGGNQRPTKATRDILWIKTSDITIVNIYRDLDVPETLEAILTWPIPDRCLIAGDFNARHCSWEPGANAEHQGGRIADWAEETELAQLVPAAPTNPWNTTIDLAFTNIPLAEAAVEEHLLTSADHYPITITIPEIRLQSRPRKRARLCTSKETQRFLFLIQEGARDLPTQTTNTDDLDSLATVITELIQISLETAGTPPRQTQRAAPWWTEECAEAALKYRQTRRRFPLGFCRAIQEARKALQKTTRYAALHTGNIAPGADGVTVQLLQLSWDHLGTHIHCLYAGCLAVGYHPQIFKSAEVVMIPKPGKRDLIKPRAWRPISLLSCLGKGLERLIAKRMAWILVQHEVLDPKQAGALLKRSAVDLAVALIHDIDQALMEGKVATLVTMDVQGAFDAVLCNRLLLRLREQGWPITLVRWVESFMTGRQASVRLQDTTIENSPYNPIYLLGNRSGRFGYADDTAILRIGNTIEETVSLANADVAELSQWGTENAVFFDPDKTEVMHFARYKKQIQEAPPVLQGTIEKQPEPAMRWLGIWFDSSLCFRAHHITYAVSPTHNEALSRKHKEKATELLNQWVSEVRDYLIVYSDGSQLQDSATGWGFVILRDSQLLQNGHGRLGLAEVYDGEIRGALEGLRAAAQIQNGEKITVCIDSTAALTSLMGTPSDSSQAEALAFQELATELRASLRWCPGYMGIPGNEMVDEQAKLGASLPNNNNTITLAAARRIARRKPLTAFQQWWKKEAPASYQRLQLQVTLREPPELSLTRNNLHRLIAARSGHGDFADYYTHKYPGSTATRTCSCGRNKTLDHIFYCRKYLGPDFERFIKLVNETGFFQKICPRN